MYEVFEIIAAWVRQRGTGNVLGFALFVVLPVLVVLTIIGIRLTY